MGILSDLYSFKDWILLSEEKTLSPGEISLWYSLKVSQPEGKEYFKVPTYLLEKMTGLSHKGLHKARLGLMTKGFIEYIQDDSAANRSGKYKFLNLCMVDVHTNVHTKVHPNTENDIKMHHIEHTEVYTTVPTTIHTKENTSNANSYNNAAKMFKNMISS